MYMKRILTTVLLLTVSVALAFAQKKTTETYEHHQARILDAVSNAYVKPLVVDLEIDKSIGNNGKIEHTWTLDRLFAESALGGDLENIHTWGTFKTTQAYKCDVLVAATFNLVLDDKAGVYLLTVTGFAGKYANWKPAETSDEWWIRIVNLKMTSEAEKVAPTKK